MSHVSYLLILVVLLSYRPPITTPDNRQLSTWNVPRLRMQLRQRIGPDSGVKDNLWSALASLANRVDRVDENSLLLQ
ncbi:uncharacterized protein P174DRAFT_436388 [Aspergillus novofumigatus IBT 16806]|uniref:Uncharacterized protein n=1 Tax=Aspergillus novofumigatus (strain IBT 16806) TaxID=1392255 RepID=A0A2I1CK32_ASPN1|nr:uncharacterized protein P174DRAFT_436388 [Aspergillus novofumigatus IBT 16806]PKX97990.1 hypothetical protein P174DRAFT_436388 [Aspergillus novofumigatus IBT 16806]